MLLPSFSAYHNQIFAFFIIFYCMFTERRNGKLSKRSIYFGYKSNDMSERRGGLVGRVKSKRKRKQERVREAEREI